MTTQPTQPDQPLPPPHTPIRNSTRNGSPSPARLSCPVCAMALPAGRARYCSAACRQRAFRLRHLRGVGGTAGVDGDGRRAIDVAALRQELQRQRTLVAHTVYECPRCEERFVGERRCPDCHIFCRALGLGGPCPACDHPIELSELLGKEVCSPPPPPST